MDHQIRFSGIFPSMAPMYRIAAIDSGAAVQIYLVLRIFSPASTSLRLDVRRACIEPSVAPSQGKRLNARSISNFRLVDCIRSASSSHAARDVYWRKIYGERLGRTDAFVRVTQCNMKPVKAVHDTSA